MATSSIEMLDLFAPELATVDDDTKEFWIELAVSWHTASEWSSATYLSAMVNAAAHLMTKAGLGSSTPSSGSAAQVQVAGPVSSQKEGDLAQAYDTGNSVAAKAVTMEEAEWASTKYGRTYLMLRSRQVSAGARLLKPG